MHVTTSKFGLALMFVALAACTDTDPGPSREEVAPRGMKSCLRVATPTSADGATLDSAVERIAAEHSLTKHTNAPDWYFVPADDSFQLIYGRGITSSGRTHDGTVIVASHSEVGALCDALSTDIKESLSVSFSVSACHWH